MNKRKSKKLTLSGETIRNLSAPDLEQAAGGVRTPDCSFVVCTATKVCSGCAPCA